MKADYLCWIILFRTVFHESSSRFLNMPKSVLAKSCIVDPTFCFVSLFSGSQTGLFPAFTSAMVVPCFQRLCPAEHLSSLIHCIRQDVESSRPQKHPGLLILGCLLPTAGMAVAQVSHEDQSLQT